jgi:hypothetical protein
MMMGFQVVQYYRVLNYSIPVLILYRYRFVHDQTFSCFFFLLEMSKTVLVTSRYGISFKINGFTVPVYEKTF